MDKKSSTIADLTGYATLLGDGFSSKVDLLSQILKGAHYPSVGRYKEKLLSNIISEYIPKNFDVGTGFVLFPSEPEEGSVTNPDFDPLNMGAHVLSSQCDIIIYDSSAFPVVFKDDDFIIVRPESVKAIIEVKGSITPKSIDDMLDSYLDFGLKWRNCQLFYKNHSQEVVPKPSLFCMGWSIYKDKKGMLATNGTKARKQIADFYKKNLANDMLTGFPVLDSLYIHNECEIGLCGWAGYEDDELVMKESFCTQNGKFTRFKPNGEAYLGGDRTIASLLASIHCCFGSNFNRFFSYHDETRQPDVHIPYAHNGFDFWIENDDDAITALNTDIPE